MGVIGQQFFSPEEEKSWKILIAIVSLYGKEGIPLEDVDEEMFTFCGERCPWSKYGADSLKSWLNSLPNIYIVYNKSLKEVVIADSPKSDHIKDLVTKQKRAHRGRSDYTAASKRKAHGDVDDENNQPAKIRNKTPVVGFVNNVSTDLERCEKFEELESMLPLFYRHQALGDDFFVDIADSKLGYYVPEHGPKKTGLCAVGQTIAELTEKVRNAVNLAPRVVVMIGFQDLINNEFIGTMITNLRNLVLELKNKNTQVSLVTLIPSPKLPDNPRFEARMDIFNKALLDYQSDPVLDCNVIDMNARFMYEAERFRRDYDRFMRVSKNDPYKVFSDYGRKIFLNTLKSSLKEQLEYELEANY